MVLFAAKVSMKMGLYIKLKSKDQALLILVYTHFHLYHVNEFMIIAIKAKL